VCRRVAAIEFLAVMLLCCCCVWYDAISSPSVVLKSFSSHSASLSFFCVFKELFSERCKIVFGLNEDGLALFLSLAVGLAALNWCRGLPAE